MAYSAKIETKVCGLHRVSGQSRRLSTGFGTFSATLATILIAVLVFAVCIPASTLGSSFGPADDSHAGYGRAGDSHADKTRTDGAAFPHGPGTYGGDPRISIVDNPAKALFNNLERTTRTVRISGYRVVFDAAGRDPERLYDRLNDRADIKYVYIFADTVIIKGPLKLPGADVWIYARELYFRDTPEGRGSIDTTPRSDWLDPAPGENGKDGERAGNILLALASEPHTPDAASATEHSQRSAAPRLIARGGDGQAAGPGVRGKDGSTLPDRTSELNRIIKDKGLTISSGAVPSGVVFYEHVKNETAKPDLANAKWPENGGDAIPPGKPGKGGSGGNVSTSFALPSGFADLSGGRGGKPGEKERAGAAGKPSPAAWIVYSVKGSRVELRTVSTHTSRPGADTRRAELAASGSEGTVSADIARNEWLSTELIRPVLSVIRDSYLNEDYEEAGKVVDEYSKALGSIKSGNDSLEHFREQIRDLRDRLAGNQDYFGNPRNWVPRLSLAACESALEKEIDDSIYTIYLARVMEEQKADYEATVDGAKQSIKANIEDLKKARSDYDGYRRQVRGLEDQSSKVSAQLDALRGELQARVDELTEQAKDDAAKNRSVALWRQALQVLAVIAKASPFYSPVTNTIGGSLTAFSKVGTEDYRSTASSLTDLLQNLNQDTFNQAASQFETELNHLDFADSTDLRSKAANLMQIAKSLNDKYTQVRKAIISSGSNDGANSRLKEIQDKLSEIEGKDTTFKALSAKIVKAKTEQDTIVRKMTETSLALGRTTSRIADDLSAIDVLNQKLSAGMGKFDAASSDYVEEMARRQQQRLFRYQYYLSRAYYFEKLKPYPAKLAVNLMLRQIENQVKHPNGPVLSETDVNALKRLFKEELRNVLGNDIDRLQTEGANSSRVFFYSLSDSELAALNATGEVEIDLTKRPNAAPVPDSTSSESPVAGAGPSAAPLAQAAGQSATPPLAQGSGSSTTAALGQAAGQSATTPLAQAAAAATIGDDNSRIIELGIAAPDDLQLEQDDTQSPADSGLIRFFFEHSPSSVFQVGGRLLSFTHDRTGADRPLGWGVTYDLSQHKLYPLEYSESDPSLLGDLGASGKDLSWMFVHPSLAGPIKISRTVSPDSGPVEIDKLRLYVKITCSSCSLRDSQPGS